MLVKNFRGEEFINRDKEIEYFLEYFNKNPRRVTWLYGPKSTGKTTLIEYIIENYILKDKNYNVKYLNFRRTLIGSFNNFIENFLEEKDEDEEIQTELNRNYNLFGVFKLEAKTLKKIKEDRKNIFRYLIEEFAKSNKKNIFIIDEIQLLEDIYMNGGKLFLNEFLNFCIALTKEMHLSHVLILTSNSIFLNKIYGDSKMEKTSQFKLIDHLPYKEIEAWLTTNSQFSILNSQLIYDYLGGCVSDIKKLLDELKEFNSLEEYLENEAMIARNRIKYVFRKVLSKEEIKIFKEIVEEILKNGYYEFKDNNDNNKLIDNVIEIMNDKEILFYDPVKNITTANSRIYEKAFERILNENS